MAKRIFESNSEMTNFWKEMSDKGYKVSTKWMKAKVKREPFSPKVISKKGYWVVTYTK